MKLFNTIGQSVKVEYNGVTLYGQLKAGFLFTNTGVVELPEGAKVTEHNIEPIKNDASIFLTDDPQTPYERAQKDKHGNFVEEVGTPDDYDEFKQGFIKEQL